MAADTARVASALSFQAIVTVSANAADVPSGTASMGLPESNNAASRAVCQKEDCEASMVGSTVKSETRARMATVGPIKPSMELHWMATPEALTALSHQALASAFSKATCSEPVLISS